MTRFPARFRQLRASRQCGLFPYLMAGFPDLATPRALAEVALEVGADGFEIGVPFSDPLADGATMQRANAAALANGATLASALELASFIRARSPEAPLALMSYYNPIQRRGEARFADDLAAAGADAVIVPDLPPEEAAGLQAGLNERGLGLVPMLAPTSPDERVRAVARQADQAFIYCVTLVGVTGARQDLSSTLGAFLQRVRASTSAPLVAGFGIAQPEHLRRVAALGADGAIVASALADLVERTEAPIEAARDYLRRMKAATLPDAAASSPA